MKSYLFPPAKVKSAWPARIQDLALRGGISQNRDHRSDAERVENTEEEMDLSETHEGELTASQGEGETSLPRAMGESHASTLLRDLVPEWVSAKGDCCGLGGKRVRKGISPI